VSKESVDKIVDPDLIARAGAVADDANRMSKTLLVFQPSPHAFVHVTRGPAPLDPDLPASAQPLAYIIFWMGALGEPQPKHDEWITTGGMFEEQGQKILMVMWVMHAREDAMLVLRHQWDCQAELPEEIQPS
jgi:hypothetical protein